MKNDNSRAKVILVNPSSATPKFSLQTLHQLTLPQSFERGEDYFASGTIVNPIRLGDRLQADCWGSEPYLVRATLNGGEVADCYCTCPYDYGGLCKHLVALLLTYLREPERFAAIDDLEATLAAKSKDDLIALINAIADVHPEILPTLIAHQTVDVEPQEQASNTPPLIQLDSYRQQIRYILQSAQSGSYGSYDYDRGGRAIAGQLRQFHAPVTRLLKQADWTNAGRLCAALIEEMNAVYDDLLMEIDYDGDIMVELQPWIEGLQDCLQQPSAVDAVLREAWLLTLLDAYFKDVIELGGVDYAFNVSEILVDLANDEEWEVIEEVVKEKLNHCRDWSRSALVALLTARREKDGNVAAARGLSKQWGTPEQQVWAWLEDGNIDQALSLMDELLSKVHLVCDVANQIAQTAQHVRALALVHTAQETSPRQEYLQWLSRYHQQQENWQTALDWQSQLVQAHRFSIRDYAKLQQIAEQLDNWPGVRSQLLTDLRDQQKFRQLIEIALYEQDWDEAIGLYQSKLSAFDQTSIGLHVANTVKPHRPRFAIAYYHQEVERAIKQRGRKSYAIAAKYTKDIKELYEQMEQSQQGADYLQQIRRGHKNLPALQDELNKAGL